MRCLTASVRCISFPWLALSDAAQPRTKRGTNPQGAFVRPWPAAPLIMRSGSHMMNSSIGTGNHRSSSTLAAAVPAASMTAGRRAVPAGNPGWYRSRDRATPVCGPLTVPGRAPGVTHVPAACAHVAVHVRRIGCRMTHDMSPADQPASDTRVTRHSHGTSPQFRATNSRPCH